ncbi:unnamed protein product, partial [marine sediment metagenome]
PVGLEAAGASYCVRLRWQPSPGKQVAWNVYRGKVGSEKLERITPAPVRRTAYSDAGAEPGVPYTYVVRAVSRRGVE